MHSAYQHLALVHVKPGMVLSHVLLDRQGQVLLPQGAVLTAPIIALLPRHGIEALAVLRDAGASAGATGSADAVPDGAILRQRLAYLFRNNDIANAASASLHHYLTAYRLGRDTIQ